MNIILDTDSYKISHWLQYPPNTTGLLSYIESRGSTIGIDGTVFFGLQMALDVLAQPITMDDVEEAKSFADVHIGKGIFPYEGWKYIVKELKGKLPVEIKAVPEGIFVPTHNVLVTICSTDEKVPWVVSWLETQLLRAVWYGSNVATISNSIRRLIYNSLVQTSDNPDGEIMFKLHDFGSRGVSSRESAAIGGAAHLINFMGSDTIVGIIAANRHYDAPMAGFSIPAAEHSTITTWGKEGELEAYRNMLKNFAKPGSIVAIVSDSYDLHKAINEFWGDKLKQEIIDSGATIVIRPDSGIPEIIVMEVLHGLDAKFGHTVNSKGFKVLNNVRVIQGDGVNEGSIRLILFKMKEAGYSTDNIAFGMGGALLQSHNRDTFKFAYKTSLAKINGQYVKVFKDPVTDPGKRSKSGNLELINPTGNDCDWKTVDAFDDRPQSFEYRNRLEQVYLNGKITKRHTLDEIRERVNVCIKAKTPKYVRKQDTRLA